MNEKTFFAVGFATLLFAQNAIADFPVRWERFPVQGNTKEEVIQSIYGSSGQATLGTTTLEGVKVDFRMMNGPNKCVFTEGVIVGSIVVHVPELANKYGVSSQLAAGFEKYAASVAAHEQKHVDIWQASYRDLAQKMSLLYGLECSDAKLRMDNISRDWRSFWDARQRDLDAREGHVGSEQIISTLSSGGSWF